MEHAEVGKFFNGINDTDVFVPIEYNVLCKALDLTPFLRQLQQMIGTPLPELPADVAVKAGDELPSGSPAAAGAAALPTRKRQAVGKLFNFGTVARRKWLKNMLLELDGQEEADRLTGDDLDVILKIHKYRRSVQRDCLVDILNSQYLYYSSGLLSEYDRYPEHRKFILDQYGYDIPIQQTTTAFKPASTRKRRTSTKAAPGAAAKATGGRGSQTILSVVDSVLSCPCSPNTCRCASLKQTFDTSVDPVVFHLWNVIAVHEFPKAHQQWRVATIYRQSVLKNLAVSSVAYLNRSLEKGHHERGRQGARVSRKGGRTVGSRLYQN